ncbi:MAG: 1-acyl-sn-glycerol-3-phosphate acyltransferase [Flavobacteriales bacterium]|nr:1-acyl-sn-glycerol-3-phosphate acyltransferase [Flavobacteriales bacterium]
MKKRTAFGHKMWHRKWLIRFFGSITYPRFNWLYKSKITGTEVLKSLPTSNVLIVSNHQTYFSDALFMLHAFQASACGRENTVKYPGYWKMPLEELYVVAAAETVDNARLTNFMKIGGCITIERTWRAEGKSINRPVNPNDTNSITKAMDAGWVVTFPQGTTKPFVPGRKGTAHIIKQQKPVVVPVVIDGFRRAFDKRGVSTKKKGVTLSLRIKQPLNIDYDDSVENIMAMIMDGIEQSEEFLKVRELETS